MGTKDKINHMVALPDLKKSVGVHLQDVFWGCNNALYERVSIGEFCEIGDVYCGPVLDALDAWENRGVGVVNFCMPDGVDVAAIHEDAALQISMISDALARYSDGAVKVDDRCRVAVLEFG